MKVLLMHRDHDFDPQRLITRRERDLRSRYSGPPLDLEQVLPRHQATLTQDLGLETVLSAMAGDDNFLYEVAKVALLSSLTDPDAIRYRQAILSDCRANAKIVRDIYQVAVETIGSERKTYWSLYSRSPSSTLHQAVDVLQMFVGALKRLRNIADRDAERFSSEGFGRLFAMLKSELGDDYFVEIARHLEQLRFPDGVLISARLGTGNKGAHYVLRKPHADKRPWPLRLLPPKPQGFSCQLHPRDEGGARSLSALNDQGLNLAANALAQSTDHILSFFQMLRTELAFYLACMNLRRQLLDLDEPVCVPAVRPAGQRTLSCSELYDASLALNMGRKVVGNDVDADGKNLFVITGANSGGKSTFLRSLGLAYLMMQAGMFVPARTFRAEICEGLFTHYKREEDTGMQHGKLDEELGRMSAIVDCVKPNSLVLFNESFASTNEREGSEIASQIVQALLAGNVKIAFVTHLYHFAQGFAAKAPTNTIFLLADRRSDGTRPFKLVESPPLKTSYGQDLYETIFANDELHATVRTHS